MKITSVSARLFPEAFLCVLMLPLLFININHFHDWGDDFAQYILQSEFMAGTIPEIPVSDVEGYSPGKKGLLFSLLLTPAILLGHEVIIAGKIIVSLSLIFCGIMFFRFLNSKYNTITSFITTLFFVYNCHVLRLKDQVLPDLLFAGIVLTVFVLIKSERQNRVVAGLFIAGIATGLKSIGFALVITLAIAILSGMIERTGPKKLKSLFYLFLPCIVILIWEILSSANRSGAAWYASVTLSNLDARTISDNFFSYKNAIVLFFEQELPLWINTMIRYFVWIGFVGGLFVSFIRTSKLTAVYVCFYIVALLIYPYSREPVRFLIPLIPFILLFILDFYSFIVEKILKKNIKAVTLIIALAFAGSQVLSTKNEIIKGHSYDPWSVESRAMIAFVSNELQESDTVAFQKPWALSLFTRRHCVPEDAAYHSNYIVFRTSVVDPEGFSTYLQADVVYKNSGYTIIKSK